MHFLETAGRWLCANVIDRSVYNLIGMILQGIFDIAGIQLLSNDVIQEFSQRVYVILGIFMLFKLTVSLLNALINPDMLTDKQQGTNKLVTRVIAMIAMLVLVDPAYNELMTLQTNILPVLPKLIIGRNIISDVGVGDDERFNGTVDTSNLGTGIAWSMYQAYFTYNPNCTYNKTAGWADNDGPLVGVGEQGIKNEMKVETINSVSEAVERVNQACPDDPDIFQYDYFWLVPSITGVILVVILFGFTLDVAIRVFKLLVLRMLAPIPIISYVDPKSSKDGAFANFIKIFLSTYIDLFLRLGIIYFVSFMVDQIVHNFNFGEITNLGFVRGAYVMIFLIIGLYFFARQAPKFIKDILGIKPGPGSVGMSGVLAGAAGLIGTRSLTGALGGFLAGTDAASTAAAQGKQGPGGWTVGRDLAAQIRTGDRNAKGGIAHRLADFENRRSMQTTARRLGITSDSLEKAKNNMYAQEAAYYAMQRRYEEARLSGVVSQDKLQAMSKAMDDQRIVFNKAKSWYDKANKLGDQYRVNPTLREEIRRDGVHHRFNEDNWATDADPIINPKATAAKTEFDRIYDEVKPQIDEAAEAVLRSRSGSNQNSNSADQGSNRPPSGPPAGQGRVF